MPEQLPNPSRKRRDLLTFLAVVAGLLLVNFIGQQFFFRLDLTQEKRYTMSAATRQLLTNLKQPVTVTVYLDGDFPPPFRRLQQSVRETLNEMQVYGGSNLKYVFIDPSAASTEKARNEYYQTLFKKGLSPTNLGANENGKRVEKIIFPWATVSAGGKEQRVLLLRGNQAAPSDVRLNQSIEGLEYELASAIRKLSPGKRKLIGVVEGHGELSNAEAGDLIGSLSQFYDVYRVDLSKVRDLRALNAVIVAKPATAYSEIEKFKLDQFITQGGNALFFVDAMRVNLDSAARTGMLSFPQPVGLDDLLFKYGVRVNADLVLDLNSGVIPLVTGMEGNKPKVEPMPWQFYPLINNFSTHPITRNLDAVYTKFVSTLDTVKATGIRKTPLFFTSRYSRVLPSPVPVNLNDARLEPDRKLYKDKFKPVAYLLEGQFSSLYANRAEPGTTRFQPATSPQAKPAKVLVVSDGDFVRSELDPKTGQPFRLGFDRLANTEFANRELVLNAVDYMLDETGLISVRGKQITLRPLDKLKVIEQRSRWQLLNLVAPLVLLGVFGAVRAWRRKRRYASF
ncbi:gliding motility-associated ABC transporter substrate-binding protein GldG [Hymenobacter sp. BT186]|uniref:Gliding motility-associated ABC transporter substrate-binding protein GldG n=1 Tax=Hymenobacter telluris TaxID=2816474 RepID=A0A939ETT5_9BACT|nr:gliding motility-associated ABC transporter substrate-binding protein GldG [Hymenobacter telluris]MBO0356570.1 gliding motility-associated ABC transporter substrate-binding protein GldG [Hymenobacter telluris]MBW3372595.1 gliding motility-associated ABC transporter substrate-binding protein GldG [Hymenobacter norwichensis]